MKLPANFIPNIEKRIGKTTAEFVELAIARGFGDPEIKPGVRMRWLKEEFSIGHHQAQAMAFAIRTALLERGDAKGVTPMSPIPYRRPVG